MKELNRFREIFWDAFHAPALESEKFLKKWNELEGLNDVIAGPLFSIYEKGECKFVFEDKERFHGINNAEDFLDWLSELIKEYAESAAELKPENETEERDLKILMYQADMKMELADLSYQVLKNPEIKAD